MQESRHPQKRIHPQNMGQMVGDFAEYRHSGEIWWYAEGRYINTISPRLPEQARQTDLDMIANPCSASHIADFSVLGRFLTQVKTPVTGYVEKLWVTGG
ncbi:hypothetical protein R1T40_02260 [Tritonibacter scottomollicae]|uniref:Uncharacterized protein n=1 Tax=Tritonibacter scottomollicae TaxID=483013 RepID=A0ABZ0HFI3_TRISK|nr:hypothetical protein R1T40_02260 [Tritonibacter scottomollicae]